MISKSVLGIIFSDSYCDCISDLTAMRTTASVPFGARYRFIDFMLSNMTNCGISKVGVITKQNFRSLMDHLGTGKPWELSRKNDGLFFLPPFNRTESYSDGRVSLLRNNQEFIEMSSEEYVCLADSNILTNIDIGEIAAAHRKSGADITVCYREGKYPSFTDTMALDLDLDETIKGVKIGSFEGEGRFGVNIVFMGRSLLQKLLAEAVLEDYKSFDRDIIDRNINKLKIKGFKINGYCAIIDSMQTYFESNMDILCPENRHSLFNDASPIYTKEYDDMPARYGICANVKNSLVADGCLIEGTVENSILFKGVHVAKGAVVRNSIIMQGGFVGDGSSLNAIVMDKYAVVKPGKTLSGDKTFPVYVGKKIVV